MRELRRIRPLAAAFHVGELVSQRRDVTRGEPGRDRRHERVVHSCPGAVREHITGARLRRRFQQRGNPHAVIDGNGDRLCVG